MTCLLRPPIMAIVESVYDSLLQCQRHMTTRWPCMGTSIQGAVDVWHAPRELEQPDLYAQLMRMIAQTEWNLPNAVGA